MAQFDKSVFQYSGKKYKFIAYLTSDYEMENSNNLKYCLDNNAIELFEFSNGFNDLWLTGSIIYTDVYGKLDKLLNLQYSFCRIYFAQATTKTDNMIQISEFSEVNKIDHVFFITNVEILDRQKTEIKYKINLVSAHIFCCLSNILYSNYNDQNSINIFDILKTCIIKAGLRVNSESFDNITTTRTLKYITNGNDNLTSIVKYLLNKLYQPHNDDDSVKFLFYNVLHDNFELFDLKNINQNNGMYEVILSMFKTNLESLSQVEESRLATKTTYSKIDTLKNLFNLVTWNYDYNDGQFNQGKVDSKTISKYMNATYNNSEYVDKILPVPETFEMFKHITEWNNDIGIYHETTDSLCNCNSLVVNTNVGINCKPGSFLNISIDRSIKEIVGDSYKNLEDIQTRYKAFEGFWVVHKIRHIISPASMSYRQNILAMRNYSIKM